MTTRVEVNCTTGEETTITLTAQEETDALAQQEARAVERAQLRAKAEASRAKDMKLVEKRVATDPDFAALARLIGVLDK